LKQEKTKKELPVSNMSIVHYLLRWI